jgi:hypothetical protein
MKITTSNTRRDRGNQSCQFFSAQSGLTNPMKTTPMKIKRILAILTAAFALLSAMNCAATSYTLTNSGAWNVSMNWTPNGIPGAGDTAIITNAGKSITGLGGASPTVTTLTINGSGAVTVDAGVLTVTGVTTIGSSGAANLTIASGATFASTGTGSGAYVFGGTSSSITNNGTFTCAGGNGSGGTTPIFQNNGSATFTGTQQEFNSAVAVIQGANAALNLSSSSSTPFGGGSSLAASATGNTVSYASGANMKVTTYYNLTLNPSGTQNWGGGASLINGTLTIAGTGNLGNLSGMTLNGNLSVAGSGQVTENALVAVGGNVTVSSGTNYAQYGINVTGTTTINGGTFLLGNQSSGSATFTGNFSMSSGAFNSSYSGQNDAVTFGGSLSVSGGAFTSGTGVATFTGSGRTITGTLSIPNVTVNGTYANAGALTVSTALAGSGTFTQNANSTLNIGGASTLSTLAASANTPNTVAYTGGAQTVKATTYNNLTVSGGNTKTLASATTVNSTLTIAASTTLADGGFTLSANGNVSNSGTHSGAGQISLNGGSALHSLSGAGAYQNLTLSDANGASIASGTSTVNGTLTLTSGVLSGGGGALTLGNSAAISVAAGSLSSLTPTFGTSLNLTYNGAGATVTGTELPAGVTVLNNLTINDAAGITLNANATLKGALTLTSGLLNTAGNQVNLASGASVSGASSSSYVNGAVQKTFATGTQSLTFPIGVGSIYAPLTLSSLSVTAGGALTATTTLGNYSPLGPSGINSAADVSQYWTVTQSGGTFGIYGATFSYPAGEAGGAAASYVVRLYNGSAWSPTTLSGTPTTTATTITGQSGFGVFAIGDQLSAQLAFTMQPGGGTAGSAWTVQPVVTVEDANGDKVPTDTSSVTLAIGTNPGAGTLSGTKTVSAVAGVANFGGLSINATGAGYTLTATDGSLTSAASSPFSINCPTLTMTPAAGALAGGTTGLGYSQTFAATNGIGSYTYAVTSGALPTGLALSSGGVLSGTPTAAAAYSFMVTATDTDGCTVGHAYSVTISCPTITVAPGSLPNFVLNAAIGNLSNSASGGTSPYSYSLSGSVPDGLSINSNTGAITGTPTNAGAYSFTVTATDTNSCVGSTTYSATVGTPPSITLQPTNTSVCDGSSAMFAATAAGDGTLSYAWRLVNTGWGSAWSVTGSNFLSSSTGNDQAGPACASFGYNDIDSSTGNAWGMYGQATAVRGFTALSAGQVFSIDMDNGNVDVGAENGFRLLQASGTNDIFKFYFLGGQSNYKYWDSTGENDTGIPFTLTGLRVEVLPGSSSGYTLVVTPCGGTPWQFFGTLPAGAIDQVLLECNNAGGNCAGCDNLYFNNILAGNNDDNAGFYTGALGSAGNTDQGSRLALGGSGSTTDSYTTPALNYPGDNGDIFQLLVYSPYGVGFSSVATALVIPLPTATVSGSATICNGGSTTVSADLTGTGPWNVTWSDGNQQIGIASSPATYSPSPSSTTTYTVTALTDANCTAQAGDLTGSAVVTVNPPPTIALGRNPVLSCFCYSSTNAELPYGATTGAPDGYSITYDSTAQAAGFADVALTPLPASPIVLAVPLAAGTNVYNGTFTVNNSSTGCSSFNYAFSVTVTRQDETVGPPVNITSISTNGDGTVTLDFTGVPGFCYLIEATAELDPPITWTILSTNKAATNGLFRFTDMDAMNYSNRFYQTIIPQ